MLFLRIRRTDTRLLHHLVEHLSSSSSSIIRIRRRRYFFSGAGGVRVSTGSLSLLRCSSSFSCSLFSSSLSCSFSSSSKSKSNHRKVSVSCEALMGVSVQPAAGRVFPEEGKDVVHDAHGEKKEPEPKPVEPFIPHIPFFTATDHDPKKKRKHVLILCTGGTLTMAPNPHLDGALTPVQGALHHYIATNLADEIKHNPIVPDITLHEYTPLVDSSDLGPADWQRLAHDIRDNYPYYDGFVIVTGTDTMAYCATALSFMLENLGKPVVFTGSQIPLCAPYSDARRNLIMALIFAASSREPCINEVTLYFHDRLLRACRSTKVNTNHLMAFDSPNQDPLATVGVTVHTNDHLFLPSSQKPLRVHSRMDTRLLTLCLVPGFDDGMIEAMLEQAAEKDLLKAIVLLLYGTGNAPSSSLLLSMNANDSNARRLNQHSSSSSSRLIQILGDAIEQRGLVVMASTQCPTGTVRLGQYAVGHALQEAGVISAHDMTLEAIACKVAFLLGQEQQPTNMGRIMATSLRGEVTTPPQ